jgi:hypothetical protein
VEVLLQATSALHGVDEHPPATIDARDAGQRSIQAQEVEGAGVMSVR